MIRKSNYGFFEIVKNIFFLIGSKLIVPSARLLRFPIVIRGRRYIDFGNNLTTGYRNRIEVNGVHDKKVLSFGDNVNMGDECRIACASNITIGNNVLIGSRVTIIDNSHGDYSSEKCDLLTTPPNDRILVAAPITIEDNVWIGDGVVVQKGVTIGFGAVVGANAVVTKNVPAGCMVGGVPAKVIRSL